MALRPRNRVLRLLQLFTRDDPVWSVEELAFALSTSASSAYRDVQDLVGSGWLDPVPGARYRLGPAFLLYDRQIRDTDALLNRAPEVFRRLFEDTTPRAVAILCRAFRDQVLCIHRDVGGRGAPIAAYDRGVAMPLFRGATSRVVLANLDARSRSRLYTTHAVRLSLPDEDRYRAELATVRRAGFCVTEGELTPSSVGIAAPLFAGRRVLGSLGLVVAADEWAALDHAAVIRAVMGAARRLQSEERTPRET